MEDSRKKQEGKQLQHLRVFLNGGEKVDKDCLCPQSIPLSISIKIRDTIMSTEER